MGKTLPILSQLTRPLRGLPPFAIATLRVADRHPSEVFQEASVTDLIYLALALVAFAAFALAVRAAERM